MKSFLNGAKSCDSCRLFIKKQSAVSTATKVASLLFALVVASYIPPFTHRRAELLRLDSGPPDKQPHGAGKP